MKRLAWIAAVVLTVLAVLWSLWVFRGAVGLLLLSVALSLVMKPAAAKVHFRFVPWPAAVVLVYVLVVAAGGLVAYLAGSHLVMEMDEALRDFTFVYKRIDAHWADGSRFQRMVADRLPPLEEVPQSMAEVPLSSVASQTFGLGRGLLSFLVHALVVVVLSIYWTIDSGRFKWLLTSLVPYARQSHVREVWQQIEEEVGAYLGGDLIEGLTAGVLLAIVFRAVGFPYPTTLAVVGALAWLVPWLGPAMAVAAVWMATGLDWVDVTPLAAVARGIVGSLLVLVTYLGVKYVLGRRLVGRRRYSSLLILVVILALVQTIGAVGLLLGAPLAVALQIIARSSLWPPAWERTGPDRDARAMETRLAEARQALSEEEDGVPAELESLVDRLDRLLEESREVLGGESKGDGPAGGPPGSDPAPAGQERGADEPQTTVEPSTADD